MRIRRRVTLAEVAERAGVSAATASYVTTGRQDMRISGEARDRVLAAVEDLGYRPNKTARSLRTTVSHTLAFLSDSPADAPADSPADSPANSPEAPQASETVLAEMLSGATAAAAEQGRLLYVAETRGDRDSAERVIGDFLDRQVDGLIYASNPARQLRLPKSLRGHPVVLLNGVAEGATVPAVLADEHGAGRAAAQLLLDAGHGEGLYLVGEEPPLALVYRERLAGVLAALTAAGERLEGSLPCRWTPDRAYAALRALLAEGIVPRGLICLTDSVALGVYQALGEAGLPVPGAVSVVSFGGSPLSGWLRPQLTTVSVPYADMGRLAVQLLATGELQPAEHRAAMPVLVRASVGPPVARAPQWRPRAESSLRP